MRFGAHAFIWEGQWDSAAARRVIEGAKNAGLDFVEIPLLRPAEFDAQLTRSLLQDNGLGATFSLGLPSEAALPNRPQEAEQFLKMALDKVLESGGSVLTGVIYGTLGELPGQPPTDENYQTIAACLKKVARYAATLQARIGIEPVNRYETYLINTAEQASLLLDYIDEQNVFIHLDTYHINIEEEGYRKPILASGARLGYIHLSESHRGTPGTGTVNWEEVFAALKAINFGGTLVMESFVKLNPDIARATCMWRDIVKDSHSLVKEGLSFLKSLATKYQLP